MRVLAFNGSPRRGWNTDMLLQKALEGAASKGAEAEMIHLYSLSYKGCQSCFACKTIGGKSYGKCAMKDDLTPVLEKASRANVLILGSPIYFGSVSGEARSFMERLFFPYLTYTNPPESLFNGEVDTAFIYTMNAPEEQMKELLGQQIAMNEFVLKMIFRGTCESLFSFETYQFEDYSKVMATRFDVEQRTKRRKEIFPIDCQKAFDMGARLAGKERSRTTKK